MQRYEHERSHFTARTQLQARKRFELNKEVPPKARFSRDWLFAHGVTQAPGSAPVAPGAAYDSAKEV